MFIRFFFLFLYFPFIVYAELSRTDRILQQVLTNECIVNTKQINIPGYPNAFNPSLVPYKDGYLLSFRYVSSRPDTHKNGYRTDFSFIGLARMNKEFKINANTVQLLNIVSYSPNFSLTAEDARLIQIGDRIFIFFNDLPPLQTPGQFAMYLGEIVEDRDYFMLKERATALQYLGAKPIEKNWSPFTVGNKLYVTYLHEPRVILEIDINTGYCQEILRTYPNWKWNLGEIRGGTPALPIQDQLLTFFHSSFLAPTRKGRAYVMGAYAFDKEFPFSLRAMTPRPLGNLTDYMENNRSKVVFPGGMVLTEKFIHVVWGKSDREIAITTFDRAKLLASMIPISSVQPHSGSSSQVLNDPPQ